MRRASVLCVILAIATLLSACLVSSGYGVRSDVAIEDGGRRLDQTLYVLCTVIRSPNAAGAQATAIGWRHWFKRRDGSILVLGDLQPCQGAPAPLIGRRRFGPGYLGLASISVQDSWLFDSAAHPTRAEVYNTATLPSQGSFRLVKADTTPAWRAPSSGLETAFPGLASLIPAPVSLGGGFGPRAGSQSYSNTMAGWFAQAFRVEGEPGCPNESAAIVTLDLKDACARLHACYGRFDEPCQVFLGALRLTPNADFSQLTLASLAPEPAYVGTLYAPGTLTTHGLDGLGSWSPQFCYLSACSDSSSRMSFQTVLYFPREHELVRISRVSRTLQWKDLRDGPSFVATRSS